MKVETLQRIMRELGWKQDGDTFSVKDGTRATLLLSTGRDTVPVPRFTTVRFEADCLTFETEDGHFFADPSTVFALRTEGDEKRSDKRPGFH